MRRAKLKNSDGNFPTHPGKEFQHSGNEYRVDMRHYPLIPKVMLMVVMRMVLGTRGLGINSTCIVKGESNREAREELGDRDCRRGLSRGPQPDVLKHFRERRRTWVLLCGRLYTLVSLLQAADLNIGGASPDTSPTPFDEAFVADKLCDDDDINRAIIWKKDRASKAGQFHGAELKKMVEKIKLMLLGSKEDILTKALDSQEHAGRVRVPESCHSFIVF
ncbi:hypothetical protein F511_10577 [Dorcoceras hygrometricum]|uniref:Uncharacterized protein n=1 Tax=Dorcoceras hygrometricum TaxID=472368 RepID=A0A2Z7CHG4_9LAMI|nr:hypothetical protein F511_10577 [Dorcoceras hygrometricum]